MAPRPAAVSVAMTIPAQPFAKSVLSGTCTEVTLAQQLIKLSHFWGQPSCFCLQPLYQELEEHGLIWNNSLCSVLAFRPFSCWKRGGRSGPRSVTEGVLAAACHGEEQWCSLLRWPQGLPAVALLVDEGWAPPSIWSTDFSLIYPPINQHIFLLLAKKLAQFTLPSKKAWLFDTRGPSSRASSRSHALPACVQDHILNLETWNCFLDVMILPEFSTCWHWGQTRDRAPYVENWPSVREGGLSFRAR